MVDVKHKERMPGASSISFVCDANLKSSFIRYLLASELVRMTCVREVVEVCVTGSAKQVQEADTGRQASTGRRKLLDVNDSTSTFMPDITACSSTAPFERGQQQGHAVDLRTAYGLVSSVETSAVADLSAAPADRCVTSVTSNIIYGAIPIAWLGNVRFCV